MNSSEHSEGKCSEQVQFFSSESELIGVFICIMPIVVLHEIKLSSLTLC